MIEHGVTADDIRDLEVEEVGGRVASYCRSHSSRHLSSEVVI